jgi:RNA polymerase sigma factor (sigma-70 family)
MNTTDDFLEHATKSIEARGARLANRGDISKEDIEDIKQQLYMHLTVQQDKFDADKSQVCTFIHHVVEKKLFNILRSKYSGKKANDQDCVSLNSIVARDDIQGANLTLEQCISNQEYQRFHQNNSDDFTDTINRKIDIENIIENLPSEQKQACLLILEGNSISETAKKIDVSRSNFYKRVIWPLREHFTQNGIAEAYFEQLIFE